MCSNLKQKPIKENIQFQFTQTRNLVVEHKGWETVTQF